MRRTAIARRTGWAGLASTTPSAVRELVDLDPFAEALIACTGSARGSGDARAFIDAMRARVDGALDLVDRVDGLSDEGAAVMVAAGFAGSPFGPAVLEPLLVLSDRRVRAALEELVESGVVVRLGRDSFAVAAALSMPPRTGADPARATTPASHRELEVADLVAQGCTNYQIGQRLQVSERTIETYVRRLFTKLQVRSRSEIAAWFMTHQGLRDH